MRGAHRMGPALPAAVLAATVGLLAGIPASAASLLTITPRTTIAPGQQQTVTFTVPAELLTHKLALSLLARLDAPQMSGSTGALQLVLNGRPLQIERLLNKATDTEMLSGLKLDWFVTGAWRIVYSPDYEAANRDNDQNCLVGGHAYDFVLDVSGLLKPGANDLVLRHSETLIPQPLVLQDVALVDAPPRFKRAETVEDPNAPLPVIAPAKVSPRDPGAQPVAPQSGQVLPGGGLRVTCGQLSLVVTSRFGVPGGGWNSLGEQRTAADEVGWTPTVTTSRTSTEVTATGTAFRLKRRVAVAPGDTSLRIQDELENLTDRDLPIAFRHAVSTAGLTGGETYLRGLRSRIRQGYDTGGDNPTVLVRANGAGIGLVAEDDVFRAQCAQVATAQPAEAALADNWFMLEPHARYTLRWSVYRVPGGDYFDFVNAIRRDWGTNFTIPGPFAFAPHPTAEAGEVPDLKAWTQNGGMRLVSLQIPMPEPLVLAHGLALRPEKTEQARLKDQAVRLRAVAPGLKVLQYLHVYITRLDAAVDEFKDARHLGPDGKQLAYPAGNWKPTFWLFLPTTTNRYGREMSTVFDLLLDGLGFDGIYWDELSNSSGEVAYRVTDHHTALADPQTHRLTEKAAWTALYCQDYQVQQARRVLNAGKLLIGNGQPVTETMTKIHFPRFVEAWNPGNLRFGHLYCPLGLSSPDKVRSEAAFVPSIRGQLENGGLWYYYCGWNVVKFTHPSAAAHLFPFTPLELHEGYLLGQERILTARSGLFGWGDQSRVKVYVYRADGQPVDGFQAPARTIKGARYTELRLPPGGLGIIERVTGN